MDAVDAELILANRSFLFSLIARGYAEEPDASFLTILGDDGTASQVGLVEAEGSAKIATLFEQLRSLSQADGAISALSRDYVRIFVGPGTLRAHPWETVQRSGRKMLFQREVLDIREAYRAAGFLPMRYQQVPDDFIGIEFDFVAKMAERALRALREGDTDSLRLTLSQSERFERYHVCSWVDDFADEVDAGYGPGFYGAFSHFAARVTQRDLAVIASLLA